MFIQKAVECNLDPTLAAAGCSRLELALVGVLTRLDDMSLFDIAVLAFLSSMIAYGQGAMATTQAVREKHELARTITIAVTVVSCLWVLFAFLADISANNQQFFWDRAVWLNPVPPALPASVVQCRINELLQGVEGMVSVLAIGVLGGILGSGVYAMTRLEIAGDTSERRAVCINLLCPFLNSTVWALLFAFAWAGLVVVMQLVLWGLDGGSGASAATLPASGAQPAVRPGAHSALLCGQPALALSDFWTQDPTTPARFVFDADRLWSKVTARVLYWLPLLLLGVAGMAIGARNKAIRIHWLRVPVPGSSIPLPIPASFTCRTDQVF